MDWKFSKGDLERFRRIARKEVGRPVGEDEAREAAAFLLDLFEICGRHRNLERTWRERLREEPGGFRIRDDAACLVCRNVKQDAPMWFDRWGPTCEPCRLMMRRHALPASVCADRSSWLDDDQVMERLGIGRRKLDAMVSRGELVARTVRGTGFRLFLIKENRILQVRQ